MRWQTRAFVAALLVTLTLAAHAGDLDSLVMQRLFSYQQGHVATSVEGLRTNVYVKHLFKTHRRNFTMWAIPTMYTMAHGRRLFVSEQYNRLTFHSLDDYQSESQVFYTTIPHNNRPMPLLLEYLTPSLYTPTMYVDHILSPFHHDNRVFYKYETEELSSRQARLHFRPRHGKNTQLVKGQATIDLTTGRVIDAEMEGEFDMLRFHTLTHQGDSGARSLLPHQCRTHVDFKFMGNHVSSDFEAVFDCPVILPDTVHVTDDRQLMDSVRPVSLSEAEQAVYDIFDYLHRTDTARQETPVATRSRNYWKELGSNIGETLVRSLRTQSANGYMKLSPILNPQYISYSAHKGLAYRIKLGARYAFSPNEFLKFNPYVGYNFKQHQVYYTLPLRFDYSLWGQKSWAELSWGNSNRIATSAVLDEIQRQQGNIPGLDGKDLDLFDDRVTSIYNHLTLTPHVATQIGFVVHQRHAVNHQAMQALGMPTEYRSLAPSVSLQLLPWHKGPLFTIDYERGLQPRSTDLEYERWEIDASMIHRMSRMQTINLRVGGGFYTNREKNYFMDFSNFHDENIPGGWDDDWTGNFQLLSSRLYNASDYYLRGNVSFESPLLAASFVPLVGRYVERERIYLSTLTIAHSPHYSELGYSFTCRYFSMGMFTNFFNLKCQEFGCKFAFELFRRW